MSKISKFKFLIWMLIISSMSSCNNDEWTKSSYPLRSNLTGIFYQHIPYKVEFNTQIEDTILHTAKNAIVERTEKGKYQINFKDSSRYNKGFVQFYTLKNKEKQIIQMINVRLRPLPITVVVQQKYTGDTIQISKLEETKIVTDVQNVGVSLMFRVMEFSLKLYNDGNLIKITQKGNQFSKEQIQLLQSMKDGKPIIIDNIIIRQFNKMVKLKEPVIYYLSHK